MNAVINPLYTRLFSDKPNETDWEAFQTFPDTKDAINPTYVDFSVSTKGRTWLGIAYNLSIFVVKFVLFPWLLYEGVKYLIGRIVMMFILPAQSYTHDQLDKQRKKIFGIFKNHSIISRHVTLQKDGITYSGLMVGTRSNIKNGHWVQHAVGNNTTFEFAVQNELNPYIKAGFNVLLVNEPNVGRSSGQANPENMGNSQEIGISFLETAVKAKKIVVAGHSIGGASIGKAILNHTFKQDVEYLVIRMMTFDTLSRMAELTAGRLGRVIINWLDYEFGSVEASQKLQENNIPEIIFEGGKDEIMKKASLTDALQKQKIIKNKTFYMLSQATHNDLPSGILASVIQNWANPSYTSRFRGWINKKISSIP